MLVQNQKIKLNLCQQKSLDYYYNKGYSCSRHKDFWIDVKDLKENSHIKVDVICDYCDIQYKMEYRHYIEEVINGYIHKCACIKCQKKKLQETIQNKYGVNSTSCLREVKEKQKQTCFKHYGVLFPMQSQEVRKTLKNNNLEKYGVESPASLKEIRNKIKQTSMKKYGTECWLTLDKAKKNRERASLIKYGVKNPFMSLQVKNRIRKTNISRYGVPNPMQNHEIAQKVRNTMYERDLVPSSKQQRYLAKLFNGKLNYPVEKYSIDILVEPNIAIEYNGGGHDLQVKLGNISYENFVKKEKARYYCLKRNGYKCITFINILDKKYNDNNYLTLLEVALDKLKENNVNWVEINLDLKYIKTKFEQLNLKEISELFE